MIGSNELDGFSTRSRQTALTSFPTVASMNLFDGNGRRCGGQSWLCGSATGDLNAHVVSRPAQCAGKRVNFAGFRGQRPRLRNDGSRRFTLSFFCRYDSLPEATVADGTVFERLL